MKIAVIVPTWNMERALTNSASFRKLAADPARVSVELALGQELLPVMELMRLGAEATDAELLAFVHDDVEVLEEGWDQRVRAMFYPKNVGMVGFGGATGLGVDTLYKVPYKLQQLARLNFYSNMEDAEVHGCRIHTPLMVSVLDGFCQVFSRAAYDAMGGWQDAIKGGMPPFHMYDAWAACRMAELGYRVWLVPVQCRHRGGMTTCSGEYQKWLLEHGWKDDGEVHKKAHEVIYDRFRNVLPLRV